MWGESLWGKYSLGSLDRNILVVDIVEVHMRQTRCDLFFLNPPIIEIILLIIIFGLIIFFNLNYMMAVK